MIDDRAPDAHWPEGWNLLAVTDKRSTAYGMAARYRRNGRTAKVVRSSDGWFTVYTGRTDGWRRA